ncbi:EAL domain-containing protein [Vibrio harveyi]
MFSIFIKVILMNVDGYFQPKLKHGVDIVSYETFIRSREFKNTESFILKQNDRLGFDINMLNYFSSSLARFNGDLPFAINIFSNSLCSEKFICACDSIGSSLKFSLELTEYERVLDFNSTKESMNYLRLMGIDCSMDDFGKGYSDIETLKKLPFEEVKLDRDMIRRTLTCRKSRIELSSFKRFVTDLGINRVVYEGIESKEMQDIILDIDNDAILQGFYYAKPKPIAELIHE